MGRKKKKQISKNISRHVFVDNLITPVRIEVDVERIFKFIINKDEIRKKIDKDV